MVRPCLCADVRHGEKTGPRQRACMSEVSSSSRCSSWRPFWPDQPSSQPLSFCHYAASLTRRRMPREHFLSLAPAPKRRRHWKSVPPVKVPTDVDASSQGAVSGNKCRSACDRGTRLYLQLAVGLPAYLEAAHLRVGSIAFQLSWLISVSIRGYLLERQSRQAEYDR